MEEFLSALCRPTIALKQICFKMCVLFLRLHGESLSGFYPYITRVNRRLAREKCSSAIRCIRSRPMMMASLSRCRTLIIGHLLNLWHCIASSRNLHTGVQCCTGCFVERGCLGPSNHCCRAAHHVGVLPRALKRHATKPLLCMMMRLSLRVQCTASKSLLSPLRAYGWR